MRRLKRVIFGENGMSPARRVSVLRIAAAALVGCIVAGPFSALNSHAQTLGAGAPNWTRVIASDREMVRNGMAPPEDIQFDIELSKLMDESKAVLASHSKVTAQAWMNKYKALMARKSAVDRKFSAGLQARTAGLNGHPDPCRSPMGKDTCAPPAPPPSSSGGGWCQVSSQGDLVPCGN